MANNSTEPIQAKSKNEPIVSKPEPVVAKNQPVVAKNKKVGKPRNYPLASGVYRFGRSKTFHKKAIYKFLDKKTPAKVKPKKPTFIEKPIGGAKNGGVRIVRVKKLRNDYTSKQRRRRHTSKGRKCFSKHKRSLRKTLSPGAIAIVLAGVHKGKRVIVLKQLATGLLLVTGPRKLNGCPLRRINQRFVIGTSTKIDVSGVKLADHINDSYFRRKSATKSAKKEAKKDGEMFEAKKQEYKPSEQRKKDQIEVDKQVMEVIKKHPEAPWLKGYLQSHFSLSKGQYPHTLIF